jgi:hypothetical protein
MRLASNNTAENQEREDERSNQALIEVWEAPGQICSHATLYRGHDEQHHEKDKQAPPGSEAAYPCIPERMRDCAHGASSSTPAKSSSGPPPHARPLRQPSSPFAVGSTPGWGG